MALLGATNSFDMTILIGTILATIVVVGIVIVIQFFFFKDKRKVFIGKWIAEVFTVIQVRKVGAYTTNIPVRKGKKDVLIPFDVSKPTFRSKRAWIYCLDVDSAQIGFDKNRFNVASELNDMVFAKGTIKHIVSGINKPQIAGFVLYILLGVAIGIPSGILIGMKLL